MSQPASPPAAAPLAQLRILAGTLISALVVLAVVLTPVLGLDGYPPVWVPVALGVLAVVMHLLVEAVGYRVPAIAPGTAAADAAPTGRAAFQTSMVLRFALCESVALVAVVAAFVVEPRTAMTYIVGGTLSLLLMAWHVWPSDRLVRRVEQQLDRDGGSSRLATVLTGSADTGAVRS
jgi:membrane protein YdbS with pleckstrin-like domain